MQLYRTSQHRYGHIESEGDVHAVEQYQLQNQGSQIHAYAAPQELAEQEKERAGAIGTRAETLFQVAVDATQIEAIIKRQEDIGDGKITCHEAQHHLEVAELGASHFYY